MFWGGVRPRSRWIEISFGWGGSNCCDTYDIYTRKNDRKNGGRVTNGGRRNFFERAVSGSSRWWLIPVQITGNGNPFLLRATGMMRYGACTGRYILLCSCSNNEEKRKEEGKRVCFFLAIVGSFVWWLTAGEHKLFVFFYF